MVSHSVTYYPAEVTFLSLPQRIKAGTQFTDPRGVQGWVDLIGLVTYREGVPARRWSSIPALTATNDNTTTSSWCGMWHNVRWHGTCEMWTCDQDVGGKAQQFLSTGADTSPARDLVRHERGTWRDERTAGYCSEAHVWTVCRTQQEDEEEHHRNCHGNDATINKARGNLIRTVPRGKFS